MVLFKKTAISLAVMMVLLIAFSAAAYANEVSVPEKVYFERADGKIIVVDYEEAIEYFWQDKKALYDATVTGITEALKNHLDVWIEMEINGNQYVLHYSEAVKDGLSYDDLIADPEQEGEKYVVDPPDPDLEMYLEGVATVKFRTPRPTDYADWYEVQETWHEPWGFSIVDVIVGEGALYSELGYYIANIEEVRILGDKATFDGDDRWRVVFSEEIELEPGDVVFRIDGDVHY